MAQTRADATTNSLAGPSDDTSYVDQDDLRAAFAHALSSMCKTKSTTIRRSCVHSSRNQSRFRIWFLVVRGEIDGEEGGCSASTMAGQVTCRNQAVLQAPGVG